MAHLVCDNVFRNFFLRFNCPSDASLNGTRGLITGSTVFKRPGALWREPL